MNSEAKIKSIAREAARSICESGAPDAARHNERNIEHAIREALKLNNPPENPHPLPSSTASSDRDGNWMAKWGACKVCDGELPHGHSNNCDIYKLECRVRQHETCLRRVLEWCEQDSPNFEIDPDAIRAALNPPNMNCLNL